MHFKNIYQWIKYNYQDDSDSTQNLITLNKFLKESKKE